ncbi:hypothetical protein pb186bvf_013153 [Paramecium bursaria]
MKHLVLCVLITIALGVDQSLVQLGEQKIQEISQTNMGKFLMDLAQTHGESRGPLDDLIQAIGDLQQELQSELQQIEDDYTRTTNEHVNTQQNLDVQIGSTEITINNAREMIDLILIPGREQVTNRIAKLNEFINDNRDALQRETLQRQNDHQSYLEKVSEHQSAISAIDESLQLINSLINGNIAFSEKKVVHQSVKLIESRIDKHNEVAPLIQVLLSLTQNFADQDGAKKIRDMLNDVRNKSVESLNQETADEKVREEEFKNRSKALNDEYNSFKKSVLEATYVLTAYENKIKSTQEQLNQNTLDLESYKESLRLDQDTQAQETQQYNELKTQYIAEIQTVRTAFDFINSAEFSNVMHQKLNSVSIV